MRSVFASLGGAGSPGPCAQPPWCSLGPGVPRPWTLAWRPCGCRLPGLSGAPGDREGSERRIDGADRDPALPQGCCQCDHRWPGHRRCRSSGRRSVGLRALRDAGVRTCGGGSLRRSRPLEPNANRDYRRSRYRRPSARGSAGPLGHHGSRLLHRRGIPGRLDSHPIPASLSRAIMPSAVVPAAIATGRSRLAPESTSATKGALPSPRWSWISPTSTMAFLRAVSARPPTARFNRHVVPF